MADYLYGGANVSALENAIIGRDRIARLLQTKTLDEAYAVLDECGVRLVRDEESGVVLREQTLLGILKDAYARMEELAPDSEALSLWRYPYDCNNIKAAIKCFARGIEPYSMMFDFGTVDVETVVKMVKDGAFYALPPAMCAAASEASAAFAKTKNPQMVDLILDRACYLDMANAAQTCGSAYVQELVCAKIDLTNVIILLRILRMKSGEVGKILMQQAFLPGGSLSWERFDAWKETDEKTLWSDLRTGAYASFAEAFLQGDGSLSLAEKLSDDFQMDMIRRTRFNLGGMEAMVAFLLGHEYEVRNLRILLSGKEAGLDVQTIRERIRESYV